MRPSRAGGGLTWHLLSALVGAALGGVVVGLLGSNKRAETVAPARPNPAPSDEGATAPNVRGKVLSAAGGDWRPVPGAWVGATQITPPTGALRRPVVDQTPRATSDGAGAFGLSLTRRAEYVITVRYPTPRIFEQVDFPRVTVDPGGRYALPPLVLQDISNPNPFTPLAEIETRLRYRLALLDFLPAEHDDRKLRQRDALALRAVERVRRGPRTVMIPAYRNPNDDKAGEVWKPVVAAAGRYRGKLQFDVILNPSSGPGQTVDPNYPPVVAECRAAGVRLLAYVSTCRGRRDGGKWKPRDRDALEAEVLKWVELYPDIAGFFFDELPEDTDANVALLKPVFQRARSALRQRTKEALLVGNPGKGDEVRGWLDGGHLDNICVYEREEGKGTPPARYQDRWLPEWAMERPAWATTDDDLTGRLSVLAYGVKDAAAALSRSRGLLVQGCSTIYVTDATHAELKDVSGQQWSRLPAYWAELLDVLALD